MFAPTHYSHQDVRVSTALEQSGKQMLQPRFPTKVLTIVDPRTYEVVNTNDFEYKKSFGDAPKAIVKEAEETYEVSPTAPKANKCLFSIDQLDRFGLNDKAAHVSHPVAPFVPSGAVPAAEQPATKLAASEYLPEPLDDPAYPSNYMGPNTLAVFNPDLQQPPSTPLEKKKRIVLTIVDPSTNQIVNKKDIEAIKKEKMLKTEKEELPKQSTLATSLTSPSKISKCLFSPDQLNEFGLKEKVAYAAELASSLQAAANTVKNSKSATLDDVVECLISLNDNLIRTQTMVSQSLKEILERIDKQERLNRLNSGGRETNP